MHVPCLTVHDIPRSEWLWWACGIFLLPGSPIEFKDILWHIWIAFDDALEAYPLITVSLAPNLSPSSRCLACTKKKQPFAYYVSFRCMHPL